MGKPTTKIFIDGMPVWKITIAARCGDERAIADGYCFGQGFRPEYHLSGAL